MQINETVHGCPVGRRCGSPERQVGDPGSPSQIRTTSGQSPLVAATGRAMSCCESRSREPSLEVLLALYNKIWKLVSSYAGRAETVCQHREHLRQLAAEIRNTIGRRLQ